MTRAPPMEVLKGRTQGRTKSQWQTFHRGMTQGSANVRVMKGNVWTTKTCRIPIKASIEDAALKSPGVGSRITPALPERGLVSFFVSVSHHRRRPPFRSVVYLREESCLLWPGVCRACQGDTTPPKGLLWRKIEGSRGQWALSVTI